MAIQKIEQYGEVLKVILRPTKVFPEGKNHFYCDSEDIDLVQSYSWYLQQHNKDIRVRAYNSFQIYYLFHRELAFKYLSYYPDYLDHISGVEFDNVDSNLNIVTNQQNSFNKPTRGYYLYDSQNNFLPCIRYNKKALYPYRVVHSELEACILQHLIETDFLKLKMQDSYYMYDFLKDRRQDLDILDLERTGVVSSEEATYKHVVRHANAWHYHRYNLADYFKDNHIPVPSYDLDEQGFMVDKITRKKLCPFY